MYAVNVIQDPGCSGSPKGSPKSRRRRKSRRSSRNSIPRVRVENSDQNTNCDKDSKDWKGSATIGDGNSLCTPERRGRAPSLYYMDGIIPGDVPVRYNFEEEEDFQTALQVFNNIEEVSFEGKGLVNVGMRMCTRCLDAGKSKGDTDVYFIDAKEIAKNRLILCRGCIGQRIKECIEMSILQAIEPDESFV